MGTAAPPSEDRGRRFATPWVVTLVVFVALALLAGGVVLIARTGGPGASSGPAGAAEQVITPLSVVGTTPGANATGVVSSTSVTVSFSTGLSTAGALPTFDPPLAGVWGQLSPTTLQFTSAGPLLPGSHETLTVPGGSAGVKGSQGQQLAAPFATSFTVADGSTLRLQQLLAQLGYLPVAFTATAPLTAPQQEADPQPGDFTWRWPNLPASLTSLWTPGAENVVTRGAVMSFEDQHGLTTDGLAGPQVWSALLQAAGTGQGDTTPYGYVAVSQSLPESMAVYQNGAVAYTSTVNTGVPGATTAPGTYPVYLRYRVTTMSGTNPDGSHYSDPGIPWVSYFNGGDALHGFDRASYGFPQSDGCVEIPPANAAVVWPMTPIGTLVTVA
jgi:peptidoglycan hydrolase-like protein with peptidoglycan-binding domain